MIAYDPASRPGCANNFFKTPCLHIGTPAYSHIELSSPAKPHTMNLHEYQAKELLKKYGVPVQEGFACSTPHDAEEAYRQIKTQYGSNFAVVKAQIHAGGRGKGKVLETGIN